MPAFGSTINVGERGSERNTSVLPYNAYDMVRVVQDDRQREATKRALLRLAAHRSGHANHWRVVLTAPWPRVHLVLTARRG